VQKSKGGKRTIVLHQSIPLIPQHFLFIQATMSILQYNGGAIIAMSGKNCVAIASDSRLGLQQQTVSCDFQKVGFYYY
jgi:20S proteasome alpha/beta subunit